MKRPDAVEKFEVDGLNVAIEYDDSPESPREDSNLGVMICWHRNYILGDRKRGEPMPFETPTEFQEWAESKESDIAIMLPLFLYDHSGITMRCNPFSCPWDSGQVGYIYITKAKMREEYSVKRISKKLIERVTKYLVGEVETYDQFLTGQVYGFTVEDKDGKHLDSCWGFYGLEYCKEQATESAKSEAKSITEREAGVEKLINTGFAL